MNFTQISRTALNTAQTELTEPKPNHSVIDDFRPVLATQNNNATPIICPTYKAGRASSRRIVWVGVYIVNRLP
jgi:hypothetical protein